MHGASMAALGSLFAVLLCLEQVLFVLWRHFRAKS